NQWLSATLFAATMLMTLHCIVQPHQAVRGRDTWTDRQMPAHRQASESSPPYAEVRAASVKQRLRLRASVVATVPVLSSDASPASGAIVSAWDDISHDLPTSHRTPLRV